MAALRLSFGDVTVDSSVPCEVQLEQGSIYKGTSDGHFGTSRASNATVPLSQPAVRKEAAVQFALILLIRA
jgi:hypothetical protein